MTPQLIGGGVGGLRHSLTAIRGSGRPSPRLKNVVFDIVPCQEPGCFQVKAQFMGIDMERFQLRYQVGDPGPGGGQGALGGR